MPDYKFQILVCDGPDCGISLGSEGVKAHFNKRCAADPELAAKAVDFTCFGRCGEGPNVFVRTLEAGEDPDDEPDFGELDGVRGFYTEVDEAKADEILEAHVRRNEPPEYAEEY